MILVHNGKTPVISPEAYVSPTATICGDVIVGANCRIMHGASIIAEGGLIEIGSHCIVLENAVIRSTSRHSTSIGSNCLIGPNSHIVGCKIEDEVFVATGASIFHGAVIGSKSEIRINGIVHLKTKLPENSTVPIGWIAVGSPAVILPPGEHEMIWAIQEPLNFPLEVYGFERREASMVKITERMSQLLKSHLDDREA
jgi:carbonic anhydrase/acetyltransferase-like protein (isoleucine patch superfamily)